MGTKLLQLASRFSRILDPETSNAVQPIIVGCGAVGRRIADLLYATQPSRLHLVDFDKVEPVNLLTQGWASADLGKSKVAALADSLHGRIDDHPTEIHTHDSRFDLQVVDAIKEQSRVTHVFSSVDTMAARAEISELVPGAWLFDTRCGGNQIRILVRPPCSLCKGVQESYLSTIVDDKDADDGDCAERLAHWTATCAATLVVAQYAGVLRRRLPDNQVLDRYLTLSPLFMIDPPPHPTW